MIPLLEAARHRWTVLLVSLAIAVLICVQAGKNWLANVRINAESLVQVERGAALEPGNGDGWDFLGRLREWDIENPDPSGAIADYREAVDRNPLSAHYWMDLASAYEATGDASHAREAFEQAKAVYPTSAEVAWNYGNFLLRQQQSEIGDAEIRRAVQTDPKLLPQAIQLAWRSNRDVNQLLDEVLPANVDAYFQALEFFTSRNEAESALPIWQRLVALGKPLPLSRSFPFLDELIREDQGDDVRRVWREALSAAGMPNNDPANHSLIWNGDFTQDFKNGGLDWRWNSPIGTAIDFDSAPSSASGRSVRVEFNGGTNLDLLQPFEYVPVEPNRTYHFHAYLRTEGITTESGVRFLIIDPHHGGRVDVLTENLTGSHPWTPVDADVTTWAGTHILIVGLRRIPSRLFEGRLGGTVWIADLSLVPSDSAAEPSPK
jgi:tetratricopeptide (TPR) repeat protein